MTDPQKQRQLIKDAIDTAAANCGGKLKLYVAINVTASWCYACINRGVVPLEMAMKLEILTKGQFLAKDLCPDVTEKINAVSNYLS